MSDPDVVVTVVRSGGIAGIRRRWEVAASAAAAPRWIALIDDCPWGESPPHVAGADMFMWRIAVSGNRVGDHSVNLPDAAVTGPWRKLVDEVRSSADSAS